jgi:hypothetical protein
MRALFLSLIGAAVLALACAAALDAMGAGTLAFGFVGCGAAAALGAAQAMLWPALLIDWRVTGRRAAAGGVVAGTTAFVLGRAPFGWLDLGALAAGLPGELQLIVLPIASTVAVIAVWPIALRNTAAR